MKLTKKLGGNGGVSYVISISGKEAAAAGLVDENGESYDLEKIVNDKNESLCIQRSLLDDKVKRVSRIIRDNMETLLSGNPIIDSRNVIYWIDRDILYEKTVDELSQRQAIAKIDGDVFIPI